MPLGQRHEPFDHRDWFFELKYDGFRALAYIDGGGARLVSKRNVIYRRFADLASHLSPVEQARQFEGFPRCFTPKNASLGPENRNQRVPYRTSFYLSILTWQKIDLPSA